MLTVEYNFRSYKAQTTPATLLVSVKDAACKVFSLDPLEYTLAYKGKVLDLTIPIRFTSLVNGAKLNLEKTKPASQARIKLRLATGDFSKSFPPSTLVGQVLEAAGSDGVAYLGDQEIPNDKSLIEIGVSGSAVFSVRPKPVGSASKPKEVKKDIPAAVTPKETPKETQEVTEKEIGESKEEENAPLLPPRPEPAADHTSGPSTPALPARPTTVVAAAPGEPTVAQSQLYLAHLKSQSQPRQMVSKSTQQNLRREKRMQQDLTIRVRLPDMSSVEGVFKPTETGEHVYDFVRGYLLNPKIEFKLETVPPGFELLPSAQLVDDTDFDARVLLQLKTNAKGPFLNDKAMYLSKQRTQQQTEQAKEQVKQAEKRESERAAKKVPKWFKLGNK